MSRVAIIGASGYTGAELIRIIAGHPNLSLAALAADKNAGKSVAEVYPGFRHLGLPVLQQTDDIDFDAVDLVFCALPHGTSHRVIRSLTDRCKVVDLSADFRIKDPEIYKKWYGIPHSAPELLQDAVYGLTEFYRDDITKARLVACTGCNAATGLYALLPLMQDAAVTQSELIIDLKTGVSGAGRSPKVGTLHAEVSEGFQAYSVASHRHLAEFDQELSRAAGKPIRVTFVPHLLPQNRGILATVYVNGDAQKIYESIADCYSHEHFIIVLPFGEHPSTRHVRGSNYAHIGVVADRTGNRVMIFVTLDNLTKGSSGQAVQNANLMLGLSETQGLEFPALVP